MIDGVYLKSLDVMNVGSLEKAHLEFGPGVSVIRGTHAIGKTTCINAIKTFFEGGSMAELVRHGQAHAEARIEWADGFTAFKTMDLSTEAGKKDEYTVEVKGPSGEVKKRVAEALQERVPKGSFSASDFLKEDPRNRAKFLIKNLQLSFTADEVNSALMPVASRPKMTAGRLLPGETQEQADARVQRDFSPAMDAEVVFPAVTGTVDLEKLDEIIATVYESRRKVNVAIRDIDGAVTELRRTLPESSDLGVPVQWSQERDSLQRKVTEIEKDISALQSKLKLDTEKAISSMKTEAMAEIHRLKDAARAYVHGAVDFGAHVDQFFQTGSGDIQEEAKTLALSVGDFITAVRKANAKAADLSTFVAATEAKLSSDLIEQTSALQNRKAVLATDLGVAKTNAERDQEAAGTRKAIETREREAEGLTAKEMRRTDILQALDKMKNKRLSELPIDGLSIKFGAKGVPIITVNSTPIERLSGQEALYFSIQCIQFATGKYPLILDEGDGLMEEYVQKLHEACMRAEPPVQVILARHSEGGGLSVVRYGLGERIAA